MKRISIKKVIELVISAVMLLFIGWVVISFIDVVLHNMTPGYEYSNANLFELLLQFVNKN